jgi:hypothetical protein
MKKNNLIILTVAFLQILILILVIFSNSYLIAQSEKIITTPRLEDKKDLIKILADKGLNFLIGFLTIKQIGEVSAADITEECCLKTKAGGICQPILSTQEDQCEPGQLVQTKCEYNADCKYGCCVDSVEGTCSTNSPQKKCTSDGGVWNSDKQCLIADCQKGCCVLGNEYKFGNEQECNYLSQLRGVETNFRSDITSEQNCLALKQTNIEGACIFQGRCVIENGRDCVNSGGTFSQGKFCSDPGLETANNYNYKSHDHSGCINGKTDIYWFDSANNREDILKTCVEGSEICTTSSAGKPVCKSTGCNDPIKAKDFYQRYGRYPKNGESWCVYDSDINHSTVGSEHWQAQCVLGEINGGGPFNLCGSNRGEICTESKIDYENDFFVSGNCVVNEASECINYNQDTGPSDITFPVSPQITGFPSFFGSNSQTSASTTTVSKMIEECLANKECLLKTVDATGYADESDGYHDNFKFQVCVPRYSKGANLKDATDDNLCSIADKTCEVVYKKSSNVDNTWEAVINKGCEWPVFTQQMNDFCTSLGDCGSNVNYIGVGTNNAYIIPKKGHKLDDNGNEKDEASDYYACETNGNGNANCKNTNWKDYVKYVTINYMQFAPTQDFEYLTPKIIGQMGLTTPEYNDKISKWLEGISGASGIIYMGLGKLAPTLIYARYSEIGLTTLGAVGTATIGASIGMLVGHTIAKIFGVTGIASTMATIGGGISGTAAALHIIGASLGTIGTILFFGGIAIIIISVIFGGPDYETRYVEFKCNPWTAPAGGKDCSKCNTNPMKPCTQYRCESLGALCTFKDDGSQNPPCISLQPTTIPPVISPGGVDKGYQLTTSGLIPGVNVKLQKQSGGCLTPGTQVNFNVNTDKVAQCKASTQRPTAPQYDSMENSLIDQSTMWLMNHTISYSVPNVDELDPTQIKGTIPNRYGDVKIYVKCQDAQDTPVFNPNDYVVDLCIDEKDTDPVDHSFTTFNPKDSSYIKYGVTEAPIIMWINEPATCKYDTLPGKDYNEMQYSFNCKTGIHDNQYFGWPCTTNITNLLEGDNIIYIKCKDQPWLTGTNDSRRQINTEDKEYTLKVSKEVLNIDSLTFSHDDGTGTQTINSGGKFKEGVEPISVNMEVATSGGVNVGICSCKWGTIENGSRWDFYNTNARIHDQTLTPRFNGTYINYIYCEDEAGNSATVSGNFTIEVDTNPPNIVRVYHDGSSLKVVTDEDSKCYYNSANCEFAIENATLMSSSGEYSTEHFTDWSTKKTYYIKCEDKFGRADADCLVVRPSG